jgi:hypothetical protein
MKRLAVVAALLMVVACQAKDENAADTAAAPAMAPAPADTGMMRSDTGMMKTDTGMMKSDTGATKTP